MIFLLIGFGSIYTIAFGQEKKSYQLTLPVFSTPIKMIPVKGGKYLMGNGSDNAPKDEQPVHEVSIGGFWMSEREITWEQYDAFVFRKKEIEQFVAPADLEKLGITGVTGATTPYVDMSFGMGKDQHPAINMTHYAAIQYCQWLSAQTGEFYRLPTEAEWEYVCKSAHLNQLKPQELQDYAVFQANYYANTASKKADGLGFYDILGNVAEWTMDQYDASFYSKKTNTDPVNLPITLYPRTARGGHWKQTPDLVTCTSRLASNSNWKKRDPQLPKSRWWLTNANFVGMRIVKPFIQPSPEEIKKYWIQVIEDYGR